MNNTESGTNLAEPQMASAVIQWSERLVQVCIYSAPNVNWCFRALLNELSRIVIRCASECEVVVSYGDTPMTSTVSELGTVAAVRDLMTLGDVKALAEKICSA